MWFHALKESLAYVLLHTKLPGFTPDVARLLSDSHADEVETSGEAELARRDHGVRIPAPRNADRVRVNQFFGRLGDGVGLAVQTYREGAQVDATSTVIAQSASEPNVTWGGCGR